MAVALSEEQVAARMARLPERFADRLDPADLKAVRRNRDAGEWFLTVQALIGSLNRLASPVSTRERAELETLLETFADAARATGLGTLLDRVTGELSALTEVPSLPEAQIEPTARTLRPTFEQRIPETDRWEMADAEDERDWLDLTQATVALLRRHRIPVTADERRTLWQLLDAMDLPKQGLAEIPRP